MRNVAMTVFAAVGLILAGVPEAVLAGERPAHKQYFSTQHVNASMSTQARNVGAYERRCMTLPCGTRWCFNVRR